MVSFAFTTFLPIIQQGKLYGKTAYRSVIKIRLMIDFFLNDNARRHIFILMYNCNVFMVEGIWKSECQWVL